MEEHVNTLESLVAQKQHELELIENGWQFYRRHEKGGEPPGNLQNITIEKANELRAEIRDLKAAADAIRPTPPVRFQAEVKP
jgi:hypothetical protein